MNCKRRKIVVAVSGASGAIYARMVVERLCREESVDEIALIFSHNGRAVMEYEHERIDTSDSRIREYDDNDMFAPPASGSAGYDSMVIVPCSMGCVGRIATGVSTDLISRAADVMIKEHRRLLTVVRESPLSTIHLRNLTTLSECGVRIIPASPSFYSFPADIESLCATVVERIIMQLDIDAPHYSWDKK